MGEKMSRKPYVREVPKYSWFFRRPRYMRYMAREVTCIFIGAYTLLLLVGVMRLSQGQAEYEAFLAALRSPVSVVFHLLALGFSVYNTATWFNVTPKALPVQIGEEFLPGGVITGAHYLGWAVLSLAVLLMAGVF
ncbi:MAG: fumarate reductase subunit C [Betaproteobacteria bacterium]|nr:fumarate reductase subunit C [Betaproteobacteria bacterium]